MFNFEVKGDDGRRTDLLSMNLDKGIVFLTGPVTDDMAAMIVSQLFYLDSQGKEAKLYISSPGGSVTAGLMIIEAMRTVSVKVSTFCIGMAASMAAVILSCGDKGCRYIAKTAEVMIHQPSVEAIGGMESDVRIMAEHMSSTKEKLIAILSERTGQEPEVLERDMDRDHYLTAEESVQYGITDRVMAPAEKEEME